MTYETLSETDVDLDPRHTAFQPNVFINIGDFLESKLALLRIYASEMGDFPFHAARRQ